MTGFNSKRAMARAKLTAELEWDIEYRACEEGMGAEDIAKDLNCPLSIVEQWFKDNGAWDEEYSPHSTINSEG